MPRYLPPLKVWINMAAARARPRFAKGLMCHMGATTPSPNVTTNEQLLCKGSGCKTIGNPPFPCSQPLLKTASVAPVSLTMSRQSILATKSVLMPSQIYGSCRLVKLKDNLSKHGYHFELLFCIAARFLLLRRRSLRQGLRWL